MALSAARCAATRFQMQTSINADGPLPLPTPAERICLLGAYDSLPTRGYLNPHRYKTQAKTMGVSDTVVRKWFSDERMRQGHHTEYTKYPTQKRGIPPAVEVRTQLPPHRGRQPPAAQTPGRPRPGCTQGTKGEYIEEETHQEEKMSVMWTEGLDDSSLGPGSANIAQPIPRTSWATDFPMEEVDGEPPLVIDIVNIESE